MCPMSDVVVESQVRLVAGLGNPGSDYVGTRHNVGFDVLDALLAKLGGSFEPRRGHQGVYWVGRLAGRPVFFLKPMTCMNVSGASVSSLCRAEGIAPGETLVVCDDMDLELGRLRLRSRGSSGGHNGTQSVIDAFGTADFARLRIGIGKAVGRKDPIEHVLSRFDVSERELVQKVVGLAVDAVKLALHRGVPVAMNAYNATDARPKPPEEAKSGTGKGSQEAGTSTVSA